MLVVIILLTIAASFAAGYTMRGLLAVALERKRRRHPLSALSDGLLAGFADIADKRPTCAALDARGVLLAELRQRNLRQRNVPSGPPAVIAQPGSGTQDPRLLPGCTGEYVPQADGFMIRHDGAHCPVHHV